MENGWRDVALLVAFFGTGVAIALAIAIPLLDQGKSAPISIAVGAWMGGYGAYFVFFVILSLQKCFERLDRQHPPKISSID